MKQWKQVSAVATAVMALASGGVHALGLGVPNSRAILGESLRMSIPLELESGEDTDDGCPQAEVFYGDSRLDAGKVILGVSPQTGRQRVITVRAIQPINEPLIEVTLSYGCGARLSRKFTVFASPPEFVPTVVLSPATTSAPTDGEGVRAGVRAPALPATVSPRASSDRAAAAAVRDPDAAPRATRPVPVRRPVKV
uniref:type IV pilus assembly protein FimV n=1 Tax=Aquabacterium sp. TaxID=1872578 RepID=UPI0027B9C480